MDSPKIKSNKRIRLRLTKVAISSFILSINGNLIFLFGLLSFLSILFEFPFIKGLFVYCMIGASICATLAIILGQIGLKNERESTKSIKHFSNLGMMLGIIGIILVLLCTLGAIVLWIYVLLTVPGMMFQNS